MLCMKQVSTEGLLQEVISQEANAIVTVGLPWSGSSQVMRSTLTKVASDQQSPVALYHMDGDQCPQIQDLYHIQTIPAMLFFRQGILVAKLSGLTNHTRLREIFIQHYHA